MGIGLGLRTVHAGDRAFDPHLAAELGPVEEQRGARIGFEVAALATSVVGVEDEAALVEALAQDHSRRRHTSRARRRQRHRLGLEGADVARVREPAPELGERIRVQVRGVEGCGPRSWRR